VKTLITVSVRTGKLKWMITHPGNIVNCARMVTGLLKIDLVRSKTTKIYKNVSEGFGS